MTEEIPDHTYAPLIPGKGVPHRVLLLLWFLAFGASAVAVLAVRSIGNLNLETDFYWTFVPVARQILAGSLQLDPYKGPGYEAVLAVVRLVSGEFFRAGMIVSLASAALMLLLLFHAVRKTFGEDAAVLVCAATAFNQVFMTLAYSASTDMFFAMLAVGVLFLLIQGNLSGRKELFLAGLTAGYAYLTRYNAIAILVAGGAGILWLCDTPIPFKRRIVAFFLYVLGASIWIIPFGLYTFHETGRFIYNDNFYNVAYEVYAKGIVRWDDYWRVIAPHFRSFVDVISFDPGKFFSVLGGNVLDHGWRDLTSLVIWPVGLGAILGIAAELRSGFTRTQAVVFLFGAVMFLVLLPVFYGERFSLFLVPFIALLCVRFLQWRGFPFLAGRLWHRISQVVMAAVLAWSLISGVAAIRADLSQEPREILTVRDEFNRLPVKPGGSTIAARKPHIAYYLGLEYLPMPYAESVPELVAALRKSHAQYLYYGPAEATLRPELRILLDTGQPQEGLSPIVETPRPRSVLYHVEPAGASGHD
jgi:hypothetical protein